MKKRSGFSLVELIIVSVMMCGVMLAIISLQTFVLNSQQKQWRMRKISGEAVYAIESIKSAMRPASVIVEPAATGIPSDRLLVYVNVNPVDMTGRVNQLAPQTYFLYCFQNDEGTLYKYIGDYPPSETFMPFWCGKPPEASQKKEAVISGFENAVVTYSFTRDPENSNAVNINYSIQYQGQEFKGYTSFNVQKSL